MIRVKVAIDRDAESRFEPVRCHAPLLEEHGVALGDDGHDATEYHVDLIAWHRKRCIEEMETSLGAFEVDYCSSRELRLEEYSRRLLTSKICVSPWGFGEFCYRDIEAMYCGCILIKPYSDFVAMSPELYRSGETYVSCAPDFHDLAEKAMRVLADKSRYDEMILRNRKLIDDFDFSDCIERLARQIRSALDGYRRPAL